MTYEEDDEQVEFDVMRSYSITEVHTVKATSELEAVLLVDKGEEDYFVRSFDGPYDADEDGNVLYNAERSE